MLGIVWFDASKRSWHQFYGRLKPCSENTSRNVVVYNSNSVQISQLVKDSILTQLHEICGVKFFSGTFATRLHSHAHRTLLTVWRGKSYRYATKDASCWRKCLRKPEMYNTCRLWCWNRFFFICNHISDLGRDARVDHERPVLLGQFSKSSQFNLGQSSIGTSFKETRRKAPSRSFASVTDCVSRRRYTVYAASDCRRSVL